MEGQTSQSSQIIEVTVDMPAGVSSLGGRRICGGAACDFSDSKSTLKDSKERSASMRKLIIAVILCIIFMSVEVIGGIKANSLAILTDAAHLLSDVAAFAISLFSLWASGWEATPRQSYGFFRIEILGALVSIQLIWLLTGILVFEAISRMINPSGEVQGFLMFAVSTFGLVVNIIMAVLLGHDHGHGGHGHGHAGHSHGHGGHGHDKHSHGHEKSGDYHSHHHDDHDHDHVGEHGHSVSFSTHHHHSREDKKDVHEPLLKHSDSEKGSSDGKKANQRNINVHSAYLHVLGDCFQSIGVMIGGAIIWAYPKWTIIDLICTLVFSVIVLTTTIKMLRNILEVLMESTPREIDATRLENGLCEMDDVVAIHELHIWAITVGKVLLACHVTITPEADAEHVLDKVIGYIRREYNISHVTIQIERA
ncbi:metal tolerance protein 1-like [Dioscorea cayenensis subsp. rotundata]|uniref:Metal tolerance protein 1-like n=1 Tax=Dioscorea cayennensis subsp. rotundata TaxID=55577 RepID=A0AB40C873_DIOCR|nr:metal tolerance protein 1-like [Dioscorea cayenensis subsp. rotundata]